jgi:hypothetical protein
VKTIIIIALVVAVGIVAWSSRYETIDGMVLPARRDRWNDIVQIWNPYRNAWQPFQIPQPTPKQSAQEYLDQQLAKSTPTPAPTPYFVVPRVIVNGPSMSFAYEDRDGKTITRPLLRGEKIPETIRIP